MPKPPKGIYAIGERVVRFGYYDRERRAGETFHAVNQVSRALLRTEELVDLRWNGAAVVRRPQSEIDDRLRAQEAASDEAHFERKREKAILLVILDEINVLRQAAGLLPRTIVQAKAAYRKKLNR